MFSVESAVRQVKPDFILQHVLEAEDGQWTRVHLDSEELETSLKPSSASASVSSDCSDPGLVLLKHGTSIKKIHRYFSQLEFRKCCLHLAGRKSTFHSLRVVLSSANLMDDGSTTRRRTQSFVTHLANQELRAFKHAYLCAAYPVLAAPDPPSPFTPSPVNPVIQPFSPHRLSDVQKASAGTATPHSLHDSGLEESEDLAFVPSESICAHLQRAFHLTDEKFRDYRYLINKTYVKKSAQKLLAEELAGQLSVLENNCHPFYRPQDFFPPSGYDIWRKAEQNHITELLGKFWHYSLPFPYNSQDLIGELHSVHDDYRILLRKLLAYERESRRQTEEEGSSISSYLSSASVRLLKEFGLRYGVGEQYRRILYLEQMSIDFSPCLWYLRHMLSVVNGISDMLPANRRSLSMVKREHEMLQSSLVRLGTQVSKTLEQMKIVFPGNKPAGAVETLITLLQRVRDVRLYLSTPVQKPPPLPDMLKDIVQGMFFKTYEKCKTMIHTDLRQSRDMHVCPRLMNALILEMRDEVLDYKNNYEATFSKYFDITVMAAKAFYSFLMKDVDLLCQQEKLRDSAIDLRMLALVYRLNQLDRDWSAYVTLQDQTWRQSFQVHIERWGLALQMHVQDLMMEIIAGDGFVTQYLHVPNDGSLHSCSSSTSPKARSVSITPSVNSAFSSFPSTPRHGSSLSNRNVNAPTSELSDDNKPTDQTHGDPRKSQATQQGEDYLTFADKRRHCASVPAFSDRPAMVRAMSDLQMLMQTQPGGLRTASAMDDLRPTEGGGLAASRLRGGWGGFGRDKGAIAELAAGTFASELGQGQKEKEPHILDSVSDCEEMDDGILQMEAPAADDEEDLSDSDDGEFPFPPIHEVTDLNVSDPTVSSSYDRNQGNGTQDAQPSGGGKPAFFVGGLSIGSQASSYNDNNSIGSLRIGGTSVVHPHANPLLNSSFVPVGAHSPHRGGLPRLMPHHASDLPTHQLSPFRKISTGSIANSSEPSSDREHHFLCSIHSSISFPSPSHSREVVIPVSGSAVDVVIILQRTLGFAKSLFRTVFPLEVRSGHEVSVWSQGEGLDLKAALRSSEDKAHLNIVQVLCQGLSVYADNMLCLDLCAVPKEIARRVIGAMLVDHAVQQQRAGLIWGCRHQLEGQENCFAFHNRHATFLCDRYEPITQKMCVRINNVTACRHYLDWCSRETQRACLHSHPSSQSQSSAASSAATGRCSSPESGTHSTAQSTRTDDSKDDSDDTNSQKRQYIDRTRTHLKAIWNALCRLLAFRINLFLRDGMAVLLSLKPNTISVEDVLAPVTSFLKSHLDALSSWLYSSSFRRVIEFLWIYIVQDIESEAFKLSRQKNYKVTPHVLLHTLSHLMKFMNNCEKGITRELMLAQAEDVMTKLQLLTLGTINLMGLYFRMMEVWSGDSNSSAGDAGQQPMRTSTLALHQMHHDLQSKRKCFSGAQLVRWIVHHSDLFMSPDELSLCGGRVVMSTQGAEDIAQQLLDQQFIVDIERENSIHSRRSSLRATPQYPAVSIHSQRGTSAEDGLDHDDSSDKDPSIDTDITPTATPRLGVVRTSQQKVVAEVHATPVDTGSPPKLSQPDSSSSGGDNSDTKPPSQSESTTPIPEVNGTVTQEAVSKPVSSDNTTQQVVSMETALVPGTVQEKNPVTSESSGIFQTVVGQGVADPKSVSAGEEVVAVVGHVTGPPAPTGLLGLAGKLHAAGKLTDGPSDFEDSGVGEAQDASMSDANENSQSAEIPAGVSGERPASNAAFSRQGTGEPSTLHAAENSNTPLAQTPVCLQTPHRESQYQPNPVYEADEGSARTTPSSMRSLTPFAMSAVFDNSPKHFYFMPAAPTQQSRSSSHQPSAQLLNGSLSYLNRTLTALKNSQETNMLAEKCFNLKIKPVSILGMIYSRRRTDSVAQTFLHELPAHVLDEVHSSIETKAVECSVL